MNNSLFKGEKMNKIFITNHASKRLHQRAVKIDWVYQVMEWGHEHYENGGYYKYILGRSQAKKAKQFGLDLCKCIGLTVIIGTTYSVDFLVTVYWAPSSTVGGN
jgi:hypothetical protein